MCVRLFSCRAIETIIIYTIEKGDWWSNTSRNVDRANLHWFLLTERTHTIFVPIDTNEFNGWTINADSLWLWCLLYINSTRLLHLRRTCAPLNSADMASPLPAGCLMRCRKQKWTDLIWFKCTHITRRKTSKDSVCQRNDREREKQQNDMWMWRNLRSIRDGTCSWCTRLWSYSQARTHTYRERDAHLYYVVIMTAIYYNCNIIIYNNTIILGACVSVCGSGAHARTFALAHYCVKFTRRLWWLHIEIDFFLSFGLGINVNVYAYAAYVSYKSTI